MASSKLMASSNPRTSDLTTTTPTATTIPTTATAVNSSTRTSSARSRRRRRNSAAAKTLASDTPVAASGSSRMNVDGILRNINTVPSSESALLDAQINLFDNPLHSHHPIDAGSVGIQELTDAASITATAPFAPSTSVVAKTYDEVWREIVAGRRELKEEPQAEPDEMMTLEDFLAKAGAVDVEEDDDVKMPLSEGLSGGVYGFDAVPSPQSTFQMLDKMEGSIIGFGSGMEVGSGNMGGGRGKRGRSALLEPLDKAAQQRQRRMIKNRESAARSRERKQAYQVELETLAMKLEEENEQLLREKEERTNERLKQLMEKVVPIVERRRPKPALRRLNSAQW